MLPSCRLYSVPLLHHYGQACHSARLYLDSQLSSLLVKSYMHYNLDCQEDCAAMLTAFFGFLGTSNLCSGPADPTGDVVAQNCSRWGIYLCELNWTIAGTPFEGVPASHGWHQFVRCPGSTFRQVSTLFPAIHLTKPSPELSRAQALVLFPLIPSCEGFRLMLTVA